MQETIEQAKKLCDEIANTSTQVATVEGYEILMNLARATTGNMRFSLETTAAIVRRHCYNVSELLGTLRDLISHLADDRAALIRALAYALATSNLSVSHESDILAHVNGYEGAPDMNAEILELFNQIRADLGQGNERDRAVNGEEIPF